MPTIQMAADTPEWVGIAAISALGFGHPQTIRQLIHRGELPARRVGGKFFVHRDDLARLGQPVGERQHDADLDQLIEKVVAEFPRLTEDQRDELGRLLADDRQ